MVLVWAALVVAWQLRQRSRGVAPLESVQSLIDTLGSRWWGAVAFLGAWTVRPAVLFPASLLALAGGVLYGPVWGVAIVVIGANLSALVAFAMGRTLGAPETEVDDTRHLVHRVSARMRTRSFATVLVLRLAGLPFDVVNLAAGFLRINPWSFLAATAIGSLPALVAIVLAGSSLPRLDAGFTGFNPTVFGVALGLVVAGLATGWWFQRRLPPETEEPPPPDTQR